MNYLCVIFCGILFVFNFALDLLTIPKKFMINYVEKDGCVKCEACERVIGTYGENAENIILPDFRCCFLEHIIDLPDCSGEREYFTINRLSEIEDEFAVPTCSSPNLSLMDVSETNLFPVEDEIQNEAIDLTISLRNNDVIDLTISSEKVDVIGLSISSKKKKALKKIFGKESPKHDAMDETIENVVRGRDLIPRPARAKLEFADFGHLQSLRNMVIDSDYFDLAVPLPGEKIPIFKY